MHRDDSKNYIDMSNKMPVKYKNTNLILPCQKTGSHMGSLITEIQSEFPNVLKKVSFELDAQRAQYKLSMGLPMDDPESTLASFDRQFGMNAQEKDAVEWAWPMEMGVRCLLLSTRTPRRRNGMNCLLSPVSG
jgi:hypothetical protein